MDSGSILNPSYKDWEAASLNALQSPVWHVQEYQQPVKSPSQHNSFEQAVQAVLLSSARTSDVRSSSGGSPSRTKLHSESYSVLYQLRQQSPPPHTLLRDDPFSSLSKGRSPNRLFPESFIEESKSSRAHRSNTGPKTSDKKRSRSVSPGYAAKKDVEVVYKKPEQPGKTRVVSTASKPFGCNVPSPSQLNSKGLSDSVCFAAAYSTKLQQAALNVGLLNPALETHLNRRDQQRPIGTRNGLPAQGWSPNTSTHRAKTSYSAIKTSPERMGYRSAASPTKGVSLSSATRAGVKPSSKPRGSYTFSPGSSDRPSSIRFSGSHHLPGKKGSKKRSASPPPVVGNVVQDQELLDVDKLASQIASLDGASLETMRGYATGYIDGCCQSDDSYSQVRTQIVKDAVLRLLGYPLALSSSQPSSPSDVASTSALAEGNKQCSMTASTDTPALVIQIPTTSSQPVDTVMCPYIDPTKSLLAAPSHSSRGWQQQDLMLDCLAPKFDMHDHCFSVSAYDPETESYLIPVVHTAIQTSDVESSDDEAVDKTTNTADTEVQCDLLVRPNSPAISSAPSPSPLHIPKLATSLKPGSVGPLLAVPPPVSSDTGPSAGSPIQDMPRLPRFVPDPQATGTHQEQMQRRPDVQAPFAAFEEVSSARSSSELCNFDQAEDELTAVSAEVDSTVVALADALEGALVLEHANMVLTPPVYASVQAPTTAPKPSRLHDVEEVPVPQAPPPIVMSVPAVAISTPGAATVSACKEGATAAATAPYVQAAPKENAHIADAHKAVVVSYASALSHDAPMRNIADVLRSRQQQQAWQEEGEVEQGEREVPLPVDDELSPVPSDTGGQEYVNEGDGITADDYGAVEHPLNGLAANSSRSGSMKNVKFNLEPEIIVANSEGLLAASDAPPSAQLCVPLPPPHTAAVTAPVSASKHSGIRSSLKNSHERGPLSLLPLATAGSGDSYDLDPGAEGGRGMPLCGIRVPGQSSSSALVAAILGVGKGSPPQGSPQFPQSAMDPAEEAAALVAGLGGDDDPPFFVSSASSQPASRSIHALALGAVSGAQPRPLPPSGEKGLMATDSHARSSDQDLACTLHADMNKLTLLEPASSDDELDDANATWHHYQQQHRSADNEEEPRSARWLPPPASIGHAVIDNDAGVGVYAEPIGTQENDGEGVEMVGRRLSLVSHAITVPSLSASVASEGSLLTADRDDSWPHERHAGAGGGHGSLTVSKVADLVNGHGAAESNSDGWGSGGEEPQVGPGVPHSSLPGTQWVPLRDVPANGSPAGGSPADGSPTNGSPADGSPANGSPAEVLSKAGTKYPTHVTVDTASLAAATRSIASEPLASTADSIKLAPNTTTTTAPPGHIVPASFASSTLTNEQPRPSNPPNPAPSAPAPPTPPLPASPATESPLPAVSTASSPTIPGTYPATTGLSSDSTPTHSNLVTSSTPSRSLQALAVAPGSPAADAAHSAATTQSAASTAQSATSSSAPSTASSRSSSRGRGGGEMRAVEPVLLEIRTLKASISTMRDVDPDALARMGELLGQLATHRNAVESKYGRGNSIAVQLRALHSDLDKWRRSVEEQVAAREADRQRDKIKREEAQRRQREAEEIEWLRRQREQEDAQERLRQAAEREAESKRQAERVAAEEANRRLQAELDAAEMGRRRAAERAAAEEALKARQAELAAAEEVARRRAAAAVSGGTTELAAAPDTRHSIAGSEISVNTDFTLDNTSGAAVQPRVQAASSTFAFPSVSVQPRHKAALARSQSAASTATRPLAAATTAAGAYGAAVMNAHGMNMAMLQQQQQQLMMQGAWSPQVAGSGAHLGPANLSVPPAMDLQTLALHLNAQVLMQQQQAGHQGMAAATPQGQAAGIMVASPTQGMAAGALQGPPGAQHPVTSSMSMPAAMGNMYAHQAAVAPSAAATSPLPHSDSKKTKEASAMRKLKGFFSAKSTSGPH